MLLIKSNLKNNWIFFLILFFSFTIDRVSKNYIINFFLDYNSNTYYLNSFLNFVLVWNTGVSFGVLQTESIYYNILTFIIFLIILAVTYFLICTKNKFEKLSYSFVIGGGAGNLYDRIVYKAVPDFIDLHYFDFHWFVFNVSDILITLGIILLLLSNLIFKKYV